MTPAEAWLAKTPEEREAVRAIVRAECEAQGVDFYGTPEQARITVEVIRSARADAEEAACLTNRRAKSSSNGSSDQSGSAA